uniref:Uncharacterized protein n=1 Tax=Buteo japonicus TaxID=224669 RepID=A0A8B9Z822_9AVES
MEPVKTDEGRKGRLLFSSHTEILICREQVFDNLDFVTYHSQILLSRNRLLNAIKPGLVKKINRLPTPIAGLVSMSNGEKSFSAAFCTLVL